MKPIRKPVPAYRLRHVLKFMVGSLIPSCLLLALAVSCFSDPGIAPVPPTGPVTEDFMRQRHQFMVDTVVERPKRLGRFLRDQQRVKAEHNLSSFDRVLSEQERILAELRKVKFRDDERFDRVLARQEELSKTLRKERGFASPRDQAVFSRLLGDQRRILAKLNQTVALDLGNYKEIQARQREFDGRVIAEKQFDLEIFDRVHGIRERLEREEAERLRREQAFALAEFEQALLEQERILMELQRVQGRNDEKFFEIQEEGQRHFKRLERQRLELQARFLERFGQPSKTQTPASSLPLSGF